MTVFNDQLSVFYPKELRMDWSKQFVSSWLADHQLQFISGHSLDSLSTLANIWIQRTAIHSNQRYPIVSSEDIRETVLEVIDSEGASQLKGIDRLKAIVRNSKPPCQCSTCSLQRAGLYVV